MQGETTMWNLITAILSGKRGADLYNVLTPEQKATLNNLAAAYGVSRRERRKMERDAKKNRR